MKIMICIKKKNKTKIIGKGSLLDDLVMITSACNAVAEKLQKQRKMKKDEAIKFVTDSILQSHDSLRR